MIDIEHCSQRLIARVLGVNERTVRAWDVPRHPDGTYSIAGVVAWRIGMVEAAAASDDDDAKEDTPLKQAQAAVAERRSQLLDIELQERRGELIQTTLVKREVRQACETFKAALGALPGKLAARLQGLAVEESAAEMQTAFDDLMLDLREAFRNAKPEETEQETAA